LFSLLSSLPSLFHLFLWCLPFLHLYFQLYACLYLVEVHSGLYKRRRPIVVTPSVYTPSHVLLRHIPVQVGRTLSEALHLCGLHSKVSSPPFTWTEEPTKRALCNDLNCGMVVLQHTFLADELVQVEHTMRAHVTGVFSPPSDFDHKTCWNTMRQFYQSLGMLHKPQWMKILHFEDDAIMESRADESLLSAYRMDFYIPSSP
jgi:hypothetical protein